MKIYRKCFLTCLLVTSFVQLVSSEVKQEQSDFQSMLRIFKNIAGSSVEVSQSNITSKEFCLKSFQKANRFKKIIMLQEQLVLKLQSQLLEQIQDCSNLRQRVHRLIANYKTVKSQLNKRP